MPHYREQQLVDLQCHLLFAVIADVERYPEFLPGWLEVTIRDRQDHVLVVDQTVGAGPIRASFRSRAELHPPRGLQIVASDGPFRKLHIEWELDPVDARRCRVTLQLAYALRYRFWIFGRLVGDAVRDLIPRFVIRAQRLHAIAPGVSVNE